MNELVAWSVTSAILLLGFFFALQVSILLLDVFRPLLQRACPRGSVRLFGLLLTGPILVVGATLIGGVFQAQGRLLQEGRAFLDRYCPPELSRHCDLLLEAADGESWLYGLILVGILGWLVARLGPLLCLFTTPDYPRLEEGPKDVRQKLDRMVSAIRSRFGVRLPEIRLMPSGASRIFVQGLFRQRIVVSHEIALKLSHRELEGVLLHEWAHTRRWDNLQAFLFEGLKRFCLFPRAFGRLLSRWRLDRELVCDDWAVALTRGPLELATALLRVSRLSTENEFPPLPAGAALVSPDTAVLQARIHNLLSGTKTGSGARQHGFCRSDASVSAVAGLWFLGIFWAFWMAGPAVLIQSHCWMESLVHGLFDLILS